MSKKVLIISQYFYPENFRINDLALELKKRGFDITVLTGLPNYPRGEYFEGYSCEKNCDELWNGIPIYRCKLRPRKQGAVNLIRNYISFVTQAKKKIKEIKLNKFDIIYVFEVSPITVALPALYLKRKYKIPVIMNVQDLWPENIIAVTGLNNKIIIGIINIIVKYIYLNCDLILAASQSFVPNIQKYLNDDKDKVKYWPQYSVVKKEEKKVDLFDEDKFNIVFTGNIGEAQGLDMVIEAANALKETKIRWHLIGDGRNENRLKEKVKEYKLQNHVLFYGRKPEKDIPQYLANADAALLILKPDPIFEMTVPAKLQTYMACGVPIIGCVSGEGKRIIEESCAGIVSDEISIHGLVNVCKKYIFLDKEIYSKLCTNSLEYGDKFFNKESLIDVFQNYINLIGGMKK